MHFCNICDNKYYIQINEKTDTIHHFCRNCGNIDNNILSNSNTIYEFDTLKSTAFKLSNAINQYTKFDPTIPRTDTIKCPNSSCKSHTNHDEFPNEILYIKYDEENIKYIYLCFHCNKSWENNS